MVLTIDRKLGSRTFPLGIVPIVTKERGELYHMIVLKSTSSFCKLYSQQQITPLPRVWFYMIRFDYRIEVKRIGLDGAQFRDNVVLDYYSIRLVALTSDTSSEASHLSFSRPATVFVLFIYIF